MGEFLIYQAEDGKTQLSVVLENETLWLSQKQLTELFGKAKGTISEHVKHIFEEGELAEDSVVRFFRTTASDGKNYDGARIRKSDVSVAKNYLTEVELRALNNLTEQYLVFAEGQTSRRIAMSMRDWITKLEGFLTLNDREILQGAGQVSAQFGKAHAEAEFIKFRENEDIRFESDFDRMMKALPIPHKPKI